MVEVDDIRLTIDPNTIRIQHKQDEQGSVVWGEMWGIVWLEGLPFCFRAWRPRNGFGYCKLVHVPYEPLGFTAPIFTEPLTADDMNYMLKGLGVTDKSLLDEALRERREAYQNFRKRYNKDPKLIRAYVDAINMAYDEKEKEPPKEPPATASVKVAP